MTDEKRSLSFRLDAEIVALLKALAARMHLSATAVIITALRDLARKEGVR